MKNTMKFIKKNWKKMISGALIALLMLVVVCFFENIKHYFFENIAKELFEDSNKHRGELIKVLLTFIAGMVAILVWHTSYKRVKVMEKQTKKTTEQIQVMYKGNVDTRFNNAVGHLGNENQSVILGGIHALHQIAVDNENYTQIVHNLFCSYLRENSAKLYKDIDFEKTPGKCPVIIQTLIDYLFKPYNSKESVYKKYKSDLSFSTLKNCAFSGVNIKNVVFFHCLLEQCYFSESNLKNCDFSFGTLTKCSFWGKTLTECSFRKGVLTECYFGNVTFTGCSFNRGILIGCNFASGILVECHFNGGTLTECDFTFGTSKECSFSDGTLNDCNFGNRTLTKCAFTSGILSECDFTFGTLSECSFSRGTLTKCDFYGGTLTDCRFVFKGFDENNAKLFDCKLKNVNLNMELPENQITEK